jgi:hypothetical protein
MQVIIAYILNAYNDSGIGSYRFDALPRIGDHIVLQFDRKSDIWLPMLSIGPRSMMLHP